MTNAEKFTEVFGTDPKRQYSTKTWWEQEFVPNKAIPTGSDVLDKIRAEIEQIKEAEYQIYGKGSWRFVDKCLDIIDKYKASPAGRKVRDWND